MPIYEFICESCQHRTEQLQRLTDPPPAACSQCGGPMCRLISRTSFQLKGSGWYKDGYGSVKPEKPEGKSAEPTAPAKTDAAASATPATPKTESATTTPKSATAKSDAKSST